MPITLIAACRASHFSYGTVKWRLIFFHSTLSSKLSEAYSWRLFGHLCGRNLLHLVELCFEDSILTNSLKFCVPCLSFFIPVSVLTKVHRYYVLQSVVVGWNVSRDQLSWYDQLDSRSIQPLASSTGKFRMVLTHFPVCTLPCISNNVGLH